MMGWGAKTGEKWLALDAVVIGIVKDGRRFELFVDPDLAFRYRRGENIALDDILKSFNIYEDARRGITASEQLVRDTFGSSDVFDVAPELIRHGEFRLTHEQREQLLREKTDAIVDSICKQAMNPQTGYPHPPDRIRSAMVEAKVRVDPFTSVEEQIPNVVKALRVILPISFDTVKVQVTIPAAYSGKGYNIVASTGVVKSDTWNTDGSWTGLVEMPASQRQQLYDELNKLTKGQVRIEVVR
ncbi:MAG: ribosome assembly factor SBDS [Candidatus Thorarchaeota archaeon]|nr:ribosome assembly factor SBDS [Candidatus Thorarchaeota archaeon]